MLVHAPAKVNLFLELKGKLATGFHELETVMAPVSWFDTLAFRASPAGAIELQVRKPTFGVASGAASESSIPEGQDNLVVQALEALRREAGVETGLSVTLVKRIPVQAGMGGGSSDAAAALMGANRFWGVGYSIRRLARIAARLGSDVPFFLHGGIARCVGRGEQVQPLPWSLDLPMVVAKPPIGLSTAEVYRHSVISQQPQHGTELLEAITRHDKRTIGHQLFNRLAEPARLLSPWIARLERMFAQTGSLGFLLSGSGSACFGIYATHLAARRAASRLRSDQQVGVRVVRTLAGGMRWGP